MNRPSAAGFTLIEVIVASAIFAAVTMALLSYNQVALRLVSRNLATNHSHDTTRMSESKLLKGVHEAASPFRLFSFDGTTFTDLDPAATTDQEPLAQKFVSARSNGVRFRIMAGGPCRLTTNTAPSATSLTFNFSTGGAVPYVPQIGDKVVLPLISREFAITAVTTTPTTGSPTGTVTVNASGGIGFTINTTTSGNVTTGYFYRSVAYSVWAGRLRFHPNFTGSNRGTTLEVRDRITSPQPFALLYAAGSSQVDNLALRISLEAYDPNYTNRRFQNGTATLQTIIPPLSVPTPVSATDSY